MAAATNLIDYQELIDTVVQPQLVDNVVLPKMAELEAIMTKNTNVKPGSTIKDNNAMTETTAGGAFTRADGDPASMSVQWARPEWAKLYYQEAAEVRVEDIQEAGDNPATGRALVQDAAERAVKQLMNTHVHSGVLTQLKADIDSASAYSDVGAVTRTSPIASYEEATDTAWTIAIMRTATKAIRAKSGAINWANYIALFETAVWEVAHPLIDALMVKSVINPGVGTIQDAGYLPVGTFDGVPVKDHYGMTTGDVLCFNRLDAQLQKHTPLQLTWKTPTEMNSWCYKVIARIGINCWYRHPALAIKLTSKD